MEWWKWWKRHKINLPTNNCSAIYIPSELLTNSYWFILCNLILFWISNNEAFASHLLLWVEIIHSVILLWLKQYSKQIRNKLQNGMALLVVLVLVVEAVRWWIGEVGTGDSAEKKRMTNMFNLVHDSEVHKVEKIWT